MHEEIRDTVAVFGIEFSVQFEIASPPWTRPMYWKEHFEIHPLLKNQRNRKEKIRKSWLPWFEFRVFS